MPESKEFPRVTGKMLGEDVKCTCERTVGLVTESGVIFFCRHCKTNVVVDIKQSKISALMRLAEMIQLV